MPKTQGQLVKELLEEAGCYKDKDDKEAATTERYFTWGSDYQNSLWESSLGEGYESIRKELEVSEGEGAKKAVARVKEAMKGSPYARPVQASSSSGD